MSLLQPLQGKLIEPIHSRRHLTRMDRFNEFALKWLQPRPMRYAFSSIASVIIFTAVFAALRPHMIALHEATVAFEQVLLSTAPDDYFLVDLDIRSEEHTSELQSRGLI